MTAQAHRPLSTFLLQAEEPTSNARGLMQGRAVPWPMCGLKAPDREHRAVRYKTAWPVFF